jgi:NADPH:quinone reductase-like Zn-dependent oxidoreductase
LLAVVLHEVGDASVLRYEDRPDPEPGDGEVLVRIEAASVNPFDWKVRRGLVERELPTVLGLDLSGVVEASNAEGLSAGDAVFGFGLGGTYAEFSRASGERVAHRPGQLSPVEAAAIPTAGLTAWQAIHDRGGVRSGHSVVVAGAAGGVGHFAVQFAKLAGARVVGIGSERNREFVLGLGADDYVDYGQQDVASSVQEADLAFDTVGGKTTTGLVATVREGGLLVTIAGAPPDDAARERGIRAELLVMRPNAADLVRIGDLVARGDVTVEIAEQIPLAEAARAHESSEAGHVRGKLVLTPRAT